jgi:hypothetical protein
LPDFKLTEPLFVTILVIAFVVANLKIYEEHETLISKLEADKVDALNAAIQEIELNKASAQHNASITGPTDRPGALSFIRLNDSGCRDIFLRGRFAFDDPLLQVAREYLQTIDHMNTLITNVEASTAKFQNAAGKVAAIKRYCGGQLHPESDGQAKSLPSLIDHLEQLIAREISTTRQNQS